MSSDSPAPASRFTVGLTGGIASGKSTIADRFAELGAAVIDTDVIAREVVAPGQPALDEIRAAFGNEVIGTDGGLDRAAMRRIVFADPSLRRRLEGILHPRIRDEASRQAAASSGPYRIVVVPLLVGSPMQEDMDRIVVVDVPEAVQLERLLGRDAGTPDEARRMIAAQASREARLAIADDVIDNGGSREDAAAQVDALHGRYVKLATA